MFSGIFKQLLTSIYIISLFFVCVNSCYAGENISEFVDSNIPVLNEELRRINSTKANRTYVDTQISTATDINDFTEKTTLTGNDIFVIEDSADSYTKKKVKYSNLIDVSLLIDPDWFYTIGSDASFHANDANQTTTSDTYNKQKEITLEATVPFTYTYRIFFHMATSQEGITAYGRIYKNGVAFGTEQSTSAAAGEDFTEDLEFDAGDTIELWIHIGGALTNTVSNFRILYDSSVFIIDTTNWASNTDP